MKKLKAFKFEMMPNGAQRCTMHQFAGAARWVYNKALETHQARRAAGEKFASHFDTCKWWPGWKAQFPWLKKAHSQILQVVLKDVHQAHKNLFEKRAGFPKFKKKGNKESFCFPQGCKLDEKNATIYLPKIGVVRYIKRHQRRMSRKVKGSHKRGLNKSILDQGWFKFKRQLAYKSAWNGGLFIEVPAAYTSQTCNHCGHVHKDNRTTQSNFTCVACGHHEHADLNAAKNILARGHRVFACGGHIRQPKPRASVASPTKQEPVEEIVGDLVHDSVGIPVL
jgi:transposase